MKIVPVILAGGSGTRLWPLSKPATPKQFLRVFGDHTLLQDTLLRTAGLAPAQVVVVTGEALKTETQAQIKEAGFAVETPTGVAAAHDPLGGGRPIAASPPARGASAASTPMGVILTEPCARNTAPAVALAAAYVRDTVGPDAVMVVLPADHHVGDTPAFVATLLAAIRAAEDGSLVTLGIQPDKPETGYGYIKVASAVRAAPSPRDTADPVRAAPSPRDTADPVRAAPSPRDTADTSGSERPANEAPGVAAGARLSQETTGTAGSERSTNEPDGVAAGARLSQETTGTAGSERSASEPDGVAAGARLSQGSAVAVERFVEKPDLATATRYLQDGGYYWNSGMFVWRADAILAAFAAHLPAVSALAAGPWAGFQTRFAEAPNISVDYAILEKAANVRMVPAAFPWSDVGTWDAVAPFWRDEGRLKKPAGAGGDGVDVYSSRKVAVVGLSDVLVVDTDEGLLVMKKGEGQNIGAVAKAVAQAPAAEPATGPVPRVVAKPWGQELIWAETGRYVGKTLTIRAGHSLSLQYHREKDETVHVLRGRLTFVHGPDAEHLTETVLAPGESFRIPTGLLHRMAALEDTDVLEVSTPQLDDVVRLIDRYGR